MYNKSEIAAALQAQNLEFQNLLLGVPTSTFFDGSSEKWSVAHHMKHITSAVSRIAQGLQNPELLPKREPATASKDYETLKNTYLHALQTTPPEKLQQLGSRVALEEYSDADAYKSQMTSGFSDAITTFNHALEGFKEENLESLGMPHPLIGVISAREMLFFAVYHNTHHHNGIEKLLESRA